MLTEAQVAALEKAKARQGGPWRVRAASIPGYCVAQDTFYVGTLKGVGRVYQQTVIDTYSKVGFAKLYDRKTPLTAADLLNDRVVPFFDAHDIALSRVLTDRGTEYCGSPERHEYELYLAIENIDHTRTKAKSPQTNGICERFHKTLLDEFYRVAFRKKLYRTIAELQTDLDDWIAELQRERARIRGAGATARPRCRPSLTAPTWRAKSRTRQRPHSSTSRQFRSGGHPPRQIEPNVRSNRYFYTP